MSTWTHITRRGILGVIALTLCACYTTQSATRDGDPAGVLRLEVTPADAHLWVDESYGGRIDRWHHQMVPVEPGLRRIELRAEGYITQRFDVEVHRGEEVTLRLEMEPEISTVAPLDEDRPEPRRRAPAPSF